MRSLNCNRALLAKRVWDLCLDPHSIWAETFRKKYPPSSNATKRKSPVQASLQKAQNISEEGTHWLIRNGETPRFWLDNWMGHSKLRNLIEGPLHENDMVLKVKDFWDNNNNQDFSVSSFDIPLHICNIIQATLRPINSVLNDSPSWNYSPNGQFTSRSAYLIFLSLPLTRTTPNWNWLWKSHTLPQVKTFLWLAFHDLLSTKNQLFKRHILSKDSCPLCLSSAESTIHILRDCPYTSTIWQNSLNPTIPHNFFTLDLPNWLKLISSSTPQTSNHNTIPWHIISPLTAWCIWTAHNKFFMEKIPFSTQAISIKAKSLAQYIWHLIPTKKMLPSRTALPTSLAPPPPLLFASLNSTPTVQPKETQAQQRLVGL